MKKYDYFFIYPETYDYFLDMSKEEKGDTLTALMDYAFNGKEAEDLTPKAQKAYNYIKDQIDEDRKHPELFIY